jgi:hypothetical protein
MPRVRSDKQPKGAVRTQEKLKEISGQQRARSNELQQELSPRNFKRVEDLIRRIESYDARVVQLLKLPMGLLGHEIVGQVPGPRCVRDAGPSGLLHLPAGKTAAMKVDLDNPPAIFLTAPAAMPAVIAARGQNAGRPFVEFFTANIRNPNTRKACYRAASEFFCQTSPRRA